MIAEEDETIVNFTNNSKKIYNDSIYKSKKKVDNANNAYNICSKCFQAILNFKFSFNGK